MHQRSSWLAWRRLTSGRNSSEMRDRMRDVFPTCWSPNKRMRTCLLYNPFRCFCCCCCDDVLLSNISPWVVVVVVIAVVVTYLSLGVLVYPLLVLWLLILPPPPNHCTYELSSTRVWKSLFYNNLLLSKLLIRWKTILELFNDCFNLKFRYAQDQ